MTNDTIRLDNPGQKTPVQEAKVRNSSLELFRIIAMILIIAHHYVVNSGIQAPMALAPSSPQSMFLYIFGAWGKTGINCFVLITGYFMCKSHITAKKFIKLLGEIMFYRIVIRSIFMISGYTPFSWTALAKMLIPITSIGSGFPAAFLVFFLCIPFLNILIRGMNEKQHIRLLLVCLFTYVFLGTVPGFSVIMNYVSWFIVLYFIASYIRIYDKAIFNNTGLWGLLALAALVISVASIVVMNLTNHTPTFFLLESNRILAIVLALCAFMFFKNLKIKTNRFINTVAASAFGVLLIHSNGDDMRHWLWQDVLRNTEMFGSKWLVAHAILSVLGIYIICTVIDYLRIKCIEKPFFKLWDKHFNKISDKYLQIESKVCRKLGIKEND